MALLREEARGRGELEAGVRLWGGLKKPGRLTAKHRASNYGFYGSYSLYTPYSNYSNYSFL